MNIERIILMATKEVLLAFFTLQKLQNQKGIKDWKKKDGLTIWNLFLKVVVLQNKTYLYGNKRNKIKIRT